MKPGGIEERELQYLGTVEKEETSIDGFTDKKKSEIVTQKAVKIENLRTKAMKSQQLRIKVPIFCLRGRRIWHCRIIIKYNILFNCHVSCFASRR